MRHVIKLPEFSMKNLFASPRIFFGVTYGLIALGSIAAIWYLSHILYPEAKNVYGLLESMRADYEPKKQYITGYFIEPAVVATTTFLLGVLIIYKPVFYRIACFGAFGVAAVFCLKGFLSSSGVSAFLILQLVALLVVIIGFHLETKLNARE